MISYSFLIVNKSHKKSKTNNKFNLLTSIACVEKNKCLHEICLAKAACFSVPQSPTVVQKLLITPVHRVACSFITMNTDMPFILTALLVLLVSLWDMSWRRAQSRAAAPSLQLSDTESLSRGSPA